MSLEKSEVEKDIGELGMLLRKREGKNVGIVLKIRNGERKRVRRIVGNSIEGRKENIVMVDGIGVNGDKKVWLMMERKKKKIRKEKESVVIESNKKIDVKLMGENVKKIIEEGESKVILIV